MVVVADIGNTNTRVGVWREGTLEQVEITATEEVAQATGEPEWLRAAAGREGGDHHLAFCSVLPEVEIAWAGWAARSGWRVLVIRGDTDTPLTNRYRDPARLGGDRLAAAVGAVRRFGTPAVVVSVGTAMVVDAVSAEGEFLGGAISVGAPTGLAALAERTRGLPLLAPGAAEAPIGANTEESLRAGATYGAAALIEGMTARLREVVGDQARLVLTGGDAELVSMYTRVEHAVIPTLTLEGVATVWEHNRAKGDADR
jgi:type III pantothenate kinase